MTLEKQVVFARYQQRTITSIFDPFLLYLPSFEKNLSAVKDSMILRGGFRPCENFEFTRAKLKVFFEIGN